MPDLVNGLGGDAGFGEGVLGRNDDSSTTAIDITSVFGAGGLNFFGTTYTTLFVNNNGNITFGSSTSQFTPQPIGQNLNFPIIAALWTDIDTRVTPDVNSQTSFGGTSTGTNLVYFDVDAANGVFTATWDDVDFYNSQIGHPAAFQIRLIDVGGGDFDIEFIYEHVVVDGQNYVNTSRAGYSPGQGRSGGSEIGISGAPQMADIDIIAGNTGDAGRYYFQVRGGVVTPGEGGAPPPPVHAVTVGVAQIGLNREGDEGVTPVEVVITRSGADLGATTVVQWEITLDDAGDLAPGQPLSGSAVFAPFETSATVVVGIQGDRQFEDDEWFHFHLTQATHGAETWDPGVDRIGVIVNDDPPVTFDFAAPAMGPEGVSGPSPIEFVVARTGELSQDSTVEWAVLLDGTADADDLDPGTLSGVITFAADQAEAIIRVDALGDLRLEADETFTVRLTTATTGTAVIEQDAAAIGTIVDDDARHSGLVAAPSALVLPEGDTGAATFNIMVMRIGDVSNAVEIPYAIALHGGLTAGEIQTDLAGIVTFGAGASLATLSVVVAADLAPEANESFLVTLGGGTLNTLTVTGVVMNDDKVSAPAFEPPGASLGEISGFMSQLMGGGLWSDGALL